MNEFDADGDGMLSDLEKIAMGYRLRKEFIADYDLDGDGEMSGAEWRAFQRGLFEQSAQGQLLMQQFDADADGVLNEEEQAAMDAHLEQQKEQRRAEDRARADTDGDGQLSEDERRAARQQERQFWQSQMTAAENNFDRDGDGELNIEESRDAWDAWVEYQTVDAFINDYDTDGDRAMGPADYDAFLSQYERRSRKADVNADGEINVQDINAFRDLVLRSRSM
jgi:Ca2+-binding EF-hand superfamily protein